MVAHSRAHLFTHTLTHHHHRRLNDPGADSLLRSALLTCPCALAPLAAKCKWASEGEWVTVLTHPLFTQDSCPELQ